MSKSGLLSRQLPFVLLAISALSFLQLAFLEFGARRALPLHPDELLFLICSVREITLGDMFGAGCHDNKTPLIYWLYELVISKTAPYDLLGLKAAAFALGTLLLGLSGWIAYRIGGLVAAALAVALGLQIFTVLPSLLALKTELLGMLFVLGGIMLLLQTCHARRFLTCAAAGALFGLAMLSKQTFVFAAIGGGVWLFCIGGRRWSERLKVRLGYLTTFFAAIVAVFILFFLYFLYHGQSLDFLSSAFLYPSLYAVADSTPWLKKIAWRLGALSDMVQPLLILNLVAVGAVVALGQRWSRRAVATAFDHSRMVLVVAVMLAMMLVPIVSPIAFRFHFLPAWLLMAIIGGIYMAPHLTTQPEASRSADLQTLRVAALAYFCATALYCWYGSPGRADRDSGDYDFRQIDLTSGGYVFGLWPEMFVAKGYVMATAVTAPQVLSGAPTSWGFIKPAAGSIKARALAVMHQHNDQKVRDDFARTPPKYILLSGEATGASESSRDISIEVLRTYVAQHCKFDRWISGVPRVAGNLFSCNTLP